jgi:4-amino-4-deoxy-L-arabinose transferase-like glycosyltransferase
MVSESVDESIDLQSDSRTDRASELRVFQFAISPRELATVIILFILSLVYFAHNLESRPFWTRGEGREAIVVKAMVEQSNYILPFRNGSDIPSKPPMFHWLASAASGISGGLSEFSIRLPSALMAASTVALTYLYCLLISGNRQAILACLLLMSSFEFIRSATHARVDMTFSAYITATLFLLYLAYERLSSGRAVSFLHNLLIVICLVAAILSKGPAGVIAATAVICVYHCYRCRFRPSETASKFPYIWMLSIVGAAIVLASIWYLLAYRIHGAIFIQTQLWGENVARVFVGGQGHQKAMYMAPLYCLAVFLPWALFAPFFRLAFKKKNEKETNHSPFHFCLSVIFVFLCLVCLSDSKRMVYFLPCIPFLAILLAAGFIRSDREKFEFQRTIRSGSFVLSILALISWIAALCLAAIVQSPDIVDRFVLFVSDLLFNDIWANKVFGILESIRKFGSLIYLSFPIVAAVAISAFLFKKRRIVVGVYLFSLSVFSVHCIVDQYVLPQIVASRDPRPFMSVVQRYVNANNLPIYELKSRWYTTRFYFDRDIPYVPSLERLSGKERAFFIVNEENSKVLMWRYPTAFLILTGSLNKAGNGRHKLVLLEQVADLTNAADAGVTPEEDSQRLAE